MALSRSALVKIDNLIDQYVGTASLALIGGTPPDKDLARKLNLGGEDAVLRAYVLGLELGSLQPYENVSLIDLNKRVDARIGRLPKATRAAVRAVKHRVGDYITDLGTRAKQDIRGLNHAIAAEDLMNVKREVANEIITGKGNLASRLRKITGEFDRNWDRVAKTETIRAVSLGQAESMAAEFGDPLVYKTWEPDVCKYCRKLYQGPDGHPRIFRLSELVANGDNYGRKANDYLATVGPTHPNSRCVLHRLPDGWGFDKDGDAVPGGEGGLRLQAHEDAFGKAVGYVPTTSEIKRRDRAVSSSWRDLKLMRPGELHAVKVEPKGPEKVKEPKDSTVSHMVRLKHQALQEIYERQQRLFNQGAKRKKIQKPLSALQYE